MSRFWEAAITKHCSLPVWPQNLLTASDTEKSFPSPHWLWLTVLHKHLSLILSQVHFLFLSPRPHYQFSFPFSALPWCPHPLSASIITSTWRTSNSLSLLLNFLKRQFHIVSRLPTRSIWKSYQLLQLGMSDLKFRIFCWRFSSFTFNTWGPWYLL